MSQPADTVSERIASVSCRRCGRDDAIEVVERPGVESSGADRGVDRGAGSG